MVAPFDPGADMAAVADNLATVQYQPRNSARGNFGATSYTVTGHKSQIDKTPLSGPMGIELPDDEATWLLQASGLNGYEARERDRIIETLSSGTKVYWIITKADVLAWGTIYQCVCTREKAGAGQPVAS